MKSNKKSSKEDFPQLVYERLTLLTFDLREMCQLLVNKGVLSVQDITTSCSKPLQDAVFEGMLNKNINQIMH